MRHYWTKEEEDFIATLIGYHPVRRLIALVKARFPLPISDLAIKAKIEKVAKANKEKIGDRVDNYSMSAVAKFLGVRDIIVRRWVNSGMKARKCGGLWIIRHQDLVEFAKANPRRLKQVSREGLEWLFEADMDWINVVIKAKPLKLLRPVYCVTTDKLYPSVRSAGLDLDISRDRIRTCLENGLPLKVSKRYLIFKYAD